MFLNIPKLHEKPPERGVLVFARVVKKVVKHQKYRLKQLVAVSAILGKDEVTRSNRVISSRKNLVEWLVKPICEVFTFSGIDCN